MIQTIMYHLFAGVLFFLLSLPLRAEDNFLHLRTALHISSNISDGKYTPEEIAEVAHNLGISVVVFTDRDLMRWEYGVWPLRNVIKKRVERNSIFTYGIKKYLKKIDELHKKFPDMVFIPGTESAPFYYWQGSPFKGNLKMYDWHKHILTIGLDSPTDYAYLPVIGNRRGLRKKFEIYMLWPFLTFVIGVMCLRRRKYSYRDYKGEQLSPYSKVWQVWGIFVIILSFLFLMNNWPFFSLKFDQYQGNLKQFPYQNFIDYVHKKGGLTFWAHPQLENVSKRGKVSFETKEHIYHLLDTKNYTGFSICYEGYQRVDAPEGIWDTLLKEYCRGRRKSPVWAIYGLAFDSIGEVSIVMRERGTVLLASEKSKEKILEAIKRGRMYTIAGQDSLNFILDEFSVSDEIGSVKGFMGDDVKVKDKPLLHIKGHFLNKKEEEVKVKVIREGKIEKTYRVKTPFEIIYKEGSLDAKSYYRLEIAGKKLNVITNPIFVSKE
jgi:hypothetical protein